MASSFVCELCGLSGRAVPVRVLITEFESEPLNQWIDGYLCDRCRMTIGEFADAVEEA